MPRADLLNPYPNEDKWRDRISAYLSTDLPLTGAEQLLAFDVVKWERGVTNTAGVFPIPEKGYYTGGINLNVSVTGISSFIIWVECKPFGGAWELCGGSMLKISGGDDFSGNVPMNSGFDFEEGDEVRVMIKRLTGTISLIAASEVVTLGTVVQPSAAITFIRADNVI